MRSIFAAVFFISLFSIGYFILVPGNVQSAPSATNLISNLEPKIDQVAATAPKTSDGSIAAIEKALREVDSELSLAEGEVEAQQRWIDQHDVKEQLNLESLSSSVRSMYFQKLTEVGNARKKEIELRFKKVKLLEAEIKLQNSGERSRS